MKNKENHEVPRLITQFIASSATAYTVSQLIKTNVATTTRFRKVQVAIGVLIISELVGNRAWTYGGEVYDQLVEFAGEIRKIVANA